MCQWRVGLFVLDIDTCWILNPHSINNVSAKEFAIDDTHLFVKKLLRHYRKVTHNHWRPSSKYNYSLLPNNLPDLSFAFHSIEQFKILIQNLKTHLYQYNNLFIQYYFI